MGRFASMALAAALALAATVSPIPGAAWKQTESQSGLPLSWEGSCYHWSLNGDGYSPLPFATLADIARTSFSSWQEPSCSCFRFVETAPTGVDEQAFHNDAKNANALIWREGPGSWPYSPAVIALTSVHYDPATGEILDADVEFNGVDFDFAAPDQGQSGVEFDLQSTLTHEIGHTLGLDHSDVPEATMFPYGGAGETWKRTLAADDEDGLCALYPAVADPGVCEGPWCGFDEEGTAGPCAAGPADAGCGCAVPGSRRTPFRGLLGRFVWDSLKPDRRARWTAPLSTRRDR
jgi:hypothetical protein